MELVKRRCEEVLTIEDRHGAHTEQCECDEGHEHMHSVAVVVSKFAYWDDETRQIQW
jgi:hypothetical protein